MKLSRILLAAFAATLLSSVPVRAHAALLDGSCATVSAAKPDALSELLADIEHVYEESRDFAFDKAAQAVGLLELTGWRYSVKPYQSKVSATLTRGSRLTPADRASLAKRGFRSVVDLTLEGAGDVEDAPRHGLRVHEVKIWDNSSPTDDQMKKYLDFVTRPQNQPAYVHCQAGKGRTGVAVAVYRMAVEGWSYDQALADAQSFGLALPNQKKYLKGFSERLAAGEIKGYPLVPRAGTAMPIHAQAP